MRARRRARLRQVASLERYTEAAQRSLDLSDMRFRNGADAYLTVLTAQTAMYSAQLTLVSARLARLTNLVDLYRYLGGGWIEHTGDAPRPADDVGSIAPASSARLGISSESDDACYCANVEVIRRARTRRFRRRDQQHVRPPTH